MNRQIVIAVVVGLICGWIGFRAGRSGMIPRSGYDKYQRQVREGIRLYKLHYFASREKMTDMFEYLDDRERRFYRAMPDSWKSGGANPQCVIDLFGNLDKWQADYLERTTNWDPQVEEVEAQIAAAVPQ